MPRKLENLLQKNCPRCGSPVLKSWDELSDEQKFLVERSALSGNFSIDERKKHRFCTRCFFEEPQPDLEKV